jgi:hypothetical protein
VTASDIVKAFQTNRLSALQGYAQEIDASYKQNQTVLEQNAQALSVWKANADNVYNMINTELGIDNSQTQKIKNNWDQWYTENQAALQTSLQQQQQQQQGLTGLLTFATTLLGILFL